MTDLTFYQNRLTKNARRLQKWAQRCEVHAYRVYDCDIPEFPVIVDYYDTETGAWIHLQEVDTGWQQTPDAQRTWMQFVSDVTAEVMQVPERQLVWKRRVRQRVKGERDEQYLATGKVGQDLIVHEGGQRFLLNLEAYLDTGLFLDHRNTRALIAQRAAGKRFLNLFAYTASFSVYAAAGGALSSESIDLSNTYLEWAARNFALNGIDAQAHRLIRADVLAWLRTAVHERSSTQACYDLIVLDPPTFSNSKKMTGILDVQRDHAWLIHQCLRLLRPGGELFFSTNLRRFKLDEIIAERKGCREISAQTIPEDFRDHKIHRCWRIETEP